MNSRKLHPLSREKQRETAERRAKVSALRLAGVRDQRSIARQLGVSQPTISRDFDVLDKLYQERAAQDIAAAKGLDLERIEELITALWPAAKKGQWLAVDRIVALMERKARLLGLDVRDDTPPSVQMQVVVLNGNGNAGADERDGAPGSLAAAWRSRGSLLAG